MKAVSRWVRLGVRSCELTTASRRQPARRNMRKAMRARLDVLDADVVRPGDAVVAVDEDEALPVVEAGAHDGLGGRAGHDDRGLRAVVQGLLQRRARVVVRPADAEHHGDAALLLQLAGQRAHEARDLRRLDVGHDDADDPGLPPREAPGEVVDVVAELVRGREHAPARLVGHARAGREGARHGRPRHAGARLRPAARSRTPGMARRGADEVMHAHRRPSEAFGGRMGHAAQMCKAGESLDFSAETDEFTLGWR